MKPVDAHCHLDFDRFDKDRKEVIERAKDSLEFVVNAGRDVKSNKESLKLAETHGNFIVPILGLHPTYKESFGDLQQVKDTIRSKNPVAIGEIGLDHHHVEDQKLRKRQGEVFRTMLEMAEELGKPVVVHSRAAEKKTVRILQEYSLEDVMLHCFNGSPKLAREAVENGMKIGVTTQVLYSSRVQKVAREIELESMLLETDSPFLYRGERNEPVNVRESAEKITDIKEVGYDKVVESTTLNARRFFR